MSVLNVLIWILAAILCPLMVLGLHRGWMTLLYLRHRRNAVALPPPCGDGELPSVTVQLPIFNERYVAERLIEAVAALDYPRGRLAIQVLDDSTDDTTEIVARCLRRLPADLSTSHVRRTERTHYKAGALAEGLRLTDTELVAVFDADFVPPRRFLRETTPLFADAKIGMVQCRWGHLNADQSLLTRMQALLLDGHFAIEHVARSRAGCFFNFNGTAGVFRRTCIDEAGGWQGDTLTEDMDLSYRAQLRGWRFVYRPEISCPAELPVDMNAFVSQQHRWAKGSIQTGRKLLGTIWRAPISLLVKTEATFHLLGNVAFPLLLALIVLQLPVLLAAQASGGREFLARIWSPLEGLPLLLATASVLLYYGLSQLGLRRWSPGTLLQLPLILAVGAGLSVSNSAAVLQGFFGETGEFRRTPKPSANGSDRERTYRSRRGWTPLVELGVGLWALVASLLCLDLALYATAVFQGLFAGGLLWVGARSLLEGREAAAESVQIPAATP